MKETLRGLLREFGQDVKQNGSFEGDSGGVATLWDPESHGYGGLHFQAHRLLTLKFKVKIQEKKDTS
jgi:hypothetical protein